MLTGKGIWTVSESEVNLAIRMAQAIGATHILFRSGRGTDYYEAETKGALERIQGAGLFPFAWPFIFCDDPAGEALVALRTWEAGYRGLVFDIEDQAAGKGKAAAELGRLLIEKGHLDPRNLYFTSFPNISAHAQIPYKEMATFCLGGFMPQCYGTFRWPARHTLEVMTYREHENWPTDWGERPALYPILGPYYDLQAKIRMTADELRIWTNELARYRPTFYSVYRAGVADPELWPVFQELRPWRPVGEQDWERAAQHAWEKIRVSFDPEMAFPRKAHEALGPDAFPIGEERRSIVDGHAWAWQLWCSGEKTAVLLTQEEHWDPDEIRVLGPFPPATPPPDQPV